MIAPFQHQFLSCNGNIVKQAKTVSSFWFGMVTRRPNHRKIIPLCSHDSQAHRRTRSLVTFRREVYFRQDLVIHAGLTHHSKIRLAVDQGDELLSLAVKLLSRRGKSIDPLRAFNQTVAVMLQKLAVK